MPRIKDITKVASICKATLKLLQRSGFTEMTMASVAAQAGIATGSIYTYFKNKEDLINKLFIDIKTEMFRNMLNAFTASNTFELNFKKCGRGTFNIARKNHKNSFLSIRLIAQVT
jgi:AcrR family transcriptional regulator